MSSRKKDLNKDDLDFRWMPGFEDDDNMRSLEEKNNKEDHALDLVYSDDDTEVKPRRVAGRSLPQRNGASKTADHVMEMENQQVTHHPATTLLRRRISTRNSERHGTAEGTQPTTPPKEDKSSAAQRKERMNRPEPHHLEDDLDDRGRKREATDDDSSSGEYDKETFESNTTSSNKNNNNNNDEKVLVHPPTVFKERNIQNQHKTVAKRAVAPQHCKRAEQPVPQPATSYQQHEDEGMVSSEEEESSSHPPAMARNPGYRPKENEEQIQEHQTLLERMVEERRDSPTRKRLAARKAQIKSKKVVENHLEMEVLRQKQERQHEKEARRNDIARKRNELYHWNRQLRDEAESKRKGAVAGGGGDPNGGEFDGV